jgi:murein DD-endopeptidase MepM/ murein hydrolase activator NlpD
MIRQIIAQPVRMDPAGSGKFGAPRKKRTHQGIDYVVKPGAEVLSPVEGKVTKRGYAYSNDLTWRIVDVTDKAGYVHRLFYVDPSVIEGQHVTPYTAVGVAQDITQRYKGADMKPHVHYQVESPDGEIVDPETL